MTWKIESISFKNFKFFKDEFTLNLGRNNLLVYGENGSGKSSIHWGFHTILQSCLKSVDETNKYFDVTNSENLRNCFSDGNEEAYIKISFVDGSNKKEFTLSKDHNNETGDTFLKTTVVASDFLNYRYLSSLFDFRNSMDNDIFPSFEKEILPYLYSSRNIKLIYPDESRKDSLELIECWRCVRKWQDFLKESEPSPEQRSTYIGICATLERILKIYLSDIRKIANQKLKDVFKIPVVISYTYDGLTDHVEDYEFCPKLILSAELNYSELHPTNSNICHLRTFFNEAKLSCIALAIRLAIVDKRLSFATHGIDYSKLLFIDDLLLSLDMSNRRLIIRILLDYSKNYQMVLFTHDRAFFHLILDEIELRGEADKWVSYEFYQPDEDVDMKELPKPCVREKGKHYIDALNLYKLYQYPAAALEIRKGFEAILCRIYPKNFTKELEKQKEVILNSTLAQFLKKWKDFCKRFNAPSTVLDMVTVDKYRDTLLNPLAHNNIFTPIYRQEVKDCLAVLKKIETQVKLLSVCGNNEVLKSEFTLTLNLSTYKCVTVVFYPKEVWRILLVDGDKYYENIKVKIKSCDTANIIKGGRVCSLESLFNKIVKYLDTQLFDYKEIGAYITNSSHVKLSDL